MKLQLSDTERAALRAALSAAVNATRAQWDSIRTIETLLDTELDDTADALAVLTDAMVIGDDDVRYFVSRTQTEEV